MEHRADRINRARDAFHVTAGNAGRKERRSGIDDVRHGPGRGCPADCKNPLNQRGRCRTRFVQCGDHNPNSPCLGIIFVQCPINRVFPLVNQPAIGRREMAAAQEGHGRAAGRQRRGVIGHQHQMAAVAGQQRLLGLGVRAPQQESLGEGSRATSAISASVTVSQPRLACEAGWPSSTVSAVFSSSTPWSAQGLRSLPAGTGCRGIPGRSH